MVVSEYGKDMLTLLTTLVVLPFIVHMLGAPPFATLAVACLSWPIASALTVYLIALRREQQNEDSR